MNARRSCVLVSLLRRLEGGTSSWSVSGGKRASLRASRRLGLCPVASVPGCTQCLMQSLSGRLLKERRQLQRGPVQRVSVFLLRRSWPLSKAYFIPGSFHFINAHGLQLQFRLGPMANKLYTELIRYKNKGRTTQILQCINILLLTVGMVEKKATIWWKALKEKKLY